MIFSTNASFEMAICLKTDKQLAKDMKWHYDKQLAVDGVLRHLADGEEWKDFDIKYPEFSSEPKNVR